MIRIAINEAILNEYIDVLKRFQVSDQLIEELTCILFSKGRVTITRDECPVNVIKDDPSDNKFLSCADAAGAKYILSGYKHLLKLGSYKDVSIVTPKQFVNL
jgi:predicted nucleic acid-binding protein